VAVRNDEYIFTSRLNLFNAIFGRNGRVLLIFPHIHTHQKVFGSCRTLLCERERCQIRIGSPYDFTWNGLATPSTATSAITAGSSKHTGAFRFAPSLEFTIHFFYKWLNPIQIFSPDRHNFSLLKVIAHEEKNRMMTANLRFESTPINVLYVAMLNVNVPNKCLYVSC
jgi:hypothetical protein